MSNVITLQSIALVVFTSISSFCLSWSSIASAQSTDKVTANKSRELSSKAAQNPQKNPVAPKFECSTRVSYRLKCLNLNKIYSKPNSNLSIRKRFSFPKLLLAQTSPLSIPSSIVEPNRPANQQLQLPESLPEKKPTPTLLTPLLNPPQLVPFQPNFLSEKKIPVKKVEVLGSTAFFPEELDEVVASFINKALTFEELLAIRTALTELYASKGYETSGAFLPPQDTSNGIVKIQVVEGKLEDVEIQGLKRLRESYVRSRFGINADAPLSFQKLENVLQLLQLDPLFSKVEAELILGTAPGLNILVLNLEEAQPLSSAVVVENSDSPSVGSTGVTGVFGYNNFLGLGDRLNAEVGYTEGVRSYSRRHKG